jgi:hypothetical protein
VIPAGFIDWSSPLKPELADAIVVLRVDRDGSHALARGVARDMAAAYGREIVAWRRDAALPATPAGVAWQRFPDAIPAPRERVVARFLDTIGWRALGLAGAMGPRRYEADADAVCIYLEGMPFGALVDRRALPGQRDCGDRLRWAPYAWRKATSADADAVS